MLQDSKIKKIGIVGLGLIGGSLAKDLKRLNYEIVGFSKSIETLTQAKNDNVIDSYFKELSESSIKDLDLIFLCGPLDKIPEHIELISKLAKHDLILTDAGSTKSFICKTAEKLLPKNITFIGGHPMAGNENAGYKSSQINLFKECAWVLSPLKSDQKSTDILNVLSSLALQLGAKPVICNFEIHDKAVALISHFPLLLSLTLCKLIKETKDKDLRELTIKLASSGFRDVSRIAGGNPEMNLNLILNNHSEIEKVLSEFTSISKDILNKKDQKEMLNILEEVSKWRNNLYNSSGKNNFLIKDSETAVK